MLLLRVYSRAVVVVALFVATAVVCVLEKRAEGGGNYYKYYFENSKDDYVYVLYVCMSVHTHKRQTSYSMALILGEREV